MTYPPEERGQRWSFLIKGLYDQAVKDGKATTYKNFGTLLGVSDVTIGKWMKGGFCDDINLWVTVAEFSGLTIGEMAEQVFGISSEVRESDSWGEMDALIYLESAQPSSLVRCLRSLTDRFSDLVAETVEPSAPVETLPPINAIAAEFSRSIQAAIAETGFTYEEISTQYEVELSCLIAVATGQKVPGLRIANALQGLLKDDRGQLYDGDALLEILEQGQLPKSAQKPPQTKRRKTPHGTS